MNFNFIDAHTHTQFPIYEEDRDDVIYRALSGGIKFINAGTNKETSLNAVLLAEKYKEGVYSAIGLHPIHTTDSDYDSDEISKSSEEDNILGEDFDHNYYYSLAIKKETVGIGECGLDYFHIDEKNNFAIEKQKDAFIKQIKLSDEVKKPLVIHCRNAFTDLIKILGEQNEISNSKNPGVIHFFTGTIDEAKKLLDMGFSFTFGGAITFPPRKNNVANSYEEIIKYIPIDRILSETDAPYLAPVPYRGKRNEPSYVVEVVKKLAEIKGVALEEMSQTILETANRIFKI
jgi:TatD DNase family protein